MTDHLSVQALDACLRQFAPITLDEMHEVALQDRVDTKYLLGLQPLYSALGALRTRYRVLEIANTRLNRYHTLYFDTPQFDLYHQHHAGKGSRYKVRARHYVGSDLTFLEVKHKTNQRRTIKTRIRIPSTDGALTADRAHEFVGEYLPMTAHQLEPKLWNDYIRITLVSNQHQERVTLDLQVGFAWDSAQTVLENVVIAEVKQARFSLESDFIQQMRHLGVRPMAFSKYTAGVMTLYPQVKHNRFKPAMQTVAKIMHSEAHYGN